MAAPPSQRYRTIGFYLEGGGQPSVRMNLAVRPEDLTRSETSRLAIQQTLGGAWADAFDRGIATINISGTNGWRGGFTLSGEDMFLQLRQTVFQGWHDRRAAAIASGIDPATVRLTFTDNLDSFASIVAPRNFVLRRSKSSPLLIRYQIQLLELGDASDPGTILDQIVNALSNPTRWLAGVTGLTNVVAEINYYASEAQSALGALANAPAQFINTGTSLISSVASAAQSLRGQFDATSSALLTAGATFCVAGRNAFDALAGSNPTLPPSELIAVMAIASCFNDAACTMANCFNIGKYFTSLDDLLGASGCSSTGGGDPASTYTTSQTNPFYTLAPATPTGPTVTIQAPAAQALTTLRGDPLGLVGQTAAIGSLMQTAACGVRVSS